MRENNFNRQKVNFSRRKVLERASDIANSCRRTFDVSFSRFSRESLCGVEKFFRAKRSCRTKSARVHLLVEEEWKLKKTGKLSLSSSFVVLNAGCHSWRRIVVGLPLEFVVIVDRY